MELQKINLDATTPTATTSEKTTLKANTKDTVAPESPPTVTPKEIPLLPVSTKRFPKKPFIFLGAFLGIILILAVAIGVPAYMVSQPVRQTMQSANAAMASLQSQDLDGAKTNLQETKKNIETTQGKYKILVWTKFIPIIRNYYLDGERSLNAAGYAVLAGEELIEAIRPYSDLLGFKTSDESKTPQAQSVEDRLVFIVQTLDAISPQLDGITQKLELAKKEVDEINPSRYPKSIAGKQVRAKIIDLQNAFNSSYKVLAEARPFIKILPELLGQDGEKTYMLLFQNDAELRSTGGFLTAYAYLKIQKGKITPLESNDIYDLDARFAKKLPAPEPIKKYLPLVNQWHLRDMNLNPDFKVSMDTFYEYYKQVSGVRNIDGIIAIDTQVPVKLLEVIGPVGVGGWGNFTAENDPRCDCPQVIYELEEIADRPTNILGRTDRKAVLGPLMHSIMANAMGSPKAKWPQLLNVGLESIKQKHTLFYFIKEDTQKHAESFNSAGRIVNFDGDYLHVNDTNLGGAKSNMFVTQEVEQEYEIGSDGSVTKTVTLVYNNPFKASNCNLEAGQLCLNGTLRDWVRIYVPKGSQLIEIVGSEVAAATTEDLEKTVFEAFFTMRPQSGSRLVFKYKLPMKDSDFSSILIQKQPGKPSAKYTINYDGEPKVQEIDTDLEIRLK